MLHVALFEPEIAGNTGTIARSCVATGNRLYLIRPLGFRLSDEAIRRAGMDYWHDTELTLHDSFQAFFERFATSFESGRVFAFTTKGVRRYTEVQYQQEDVLLFGPESRGLPGSVQELCQPVRIPMRPEARSLNLAVSAGIAMYEAWRQLGFH